MKFKIAYKFLGVLLKEKEFDSQKSLYQWLIRNTEKLKKNSAPYVLYLYKGEKVEQFTTIGNRTVTFSELKKTVKKIESDEYVLYKK